MIFLPTERCVTDNSFEDLHTLHKKSYLFSFSFCFYIEVFYAYVWFLYSFSNNGTRFLHGCSFLLKPCCYCARLNNVFASFQGSAI